MQETREQGHTNLVLLTFLSNVGPCNPKQMHKLTKAFAVRIQIKTPAKI